MKIKDRTDIKVFNYNTSWVNFKTPNREGMFRFMEDGKPIMEYMTFQEIEYINNRTDTFKNGILVFEESDQAEIYDALNIKDWKDKILFESKIDDIIFNPSVENIQKIIEMRDIISIERIRGKLNGYVNQGNYDISTRVSTVVKQRFVELSNGKIKSDITIKKNQKFEKKESVESLKAENSEIKSEMAEMKKMIEQMMAQNKPVKDKPAKPTKDNSANKVIKDETEIK